VETAKQETTERVGSPERWASLPSTGSDDNDYITNVNPTFVARRVHHDG